MKLLGVEYDRAPWLSLTFMAKRGAETDPLDKPGVADWAAELLTLGTARRSQLQLAGCRFQANRVFAIHKRLNPFQASGWIYNSSRLVSFGNDLQVQRLSLFHGWKVELSF
jgi:hypothetical protein